MVNNPINDVIEHDDDDFETEDCPELEEAVYIFNNDGATKLDVPDDKETK